MKWHDLFKSSFGKIMEIPSEQEIEEIHKLKMSFCPISIFKYRAPTDYAIDNLENDTVWISSPSKYNDVFECCEKLNTTKFRLEKKSPLNSIIIDICNRHSLNQKTQSEALSHQTPFEYLYHEIKNSENGFTNFKDEKIFKTIALSHSHSQNFLKENHFKIKQDSLRLCSFCESPKVLLMWSHYAQNHTGFCVEYDITKWEYDDKRKVLLTPIEYTDDLFDITDHLISESKYGDSNQYVNYISAARKSRHWSYEKEWRLIFLDEKYKEEQNISMDCTTKVYLGCNMRDDYKNRVINICNEKGYQIVYVKRSFDKYELIYSNTK